MHEKIDIAITCNQCQHAFQWSGAKEVHEADPRDEDGIKPTAPGCPRCSFPVSMRQLKFDRAVVERFARAGMLALQPGRVHVCPVGVWGIRGGFITIERFPPTMGAVEVGHRFDEALVKSGYSQKGSTWIRSEIVGEGRLRGGVDRERIMVHWDGRFLYWTPTMDWIQVAPQHIPEEQRQTLA